MSEWNSTQYEKFVNERTRPSVDLVSRVEINPKTILDIGCGPGNSSAVLREFFPDANILGVDNSDNMLQKARKSHPEIAFAKCLVPDELDNLGTFDLVFSNACLHWIKDHKSLLPRIFACVNDGGALAVQMPDTDGAPFYRALYRLVKNERWSKLQKIKNFHNLPPEQTFDLLLDLTENITMWETSYYHLVSSHEQVIEWYKGSGLKPYLDALEEKEREVFTAELLSKVKEIFPLQKDNSVILKMPRLFFVAKKY